MRVYVTRTMEFRLRCLHVYACTTHGVLGYEEMKAREKEKKITLSNKNKISKERKKEANEVEENGIESYEMTKRTKENTSS